MIGPTHVDPIICNRSYLFTCLPHTHKDVPISIVCRPILRAQLFNPLGIGGCPSAVRVFALGHVVSENANR